jgi:hypothetical protein
MILFCPKFAICQNDNFKATASQIDGEILIDGLLDDQLWQNAQPVTGFIQFQPHRGDPASEKTEVRILYNDRWIYFGFLCYDTDPSKIVYGTSKRDKISRGIDVVTVAIDTFHDRRSAYYFRTSILGAQEDGRVSEDGRAINDKWDGEWRSVGARNETGWGMEIAIPFSTIKFNEGNNQTGGVMLSRHIPRNIERSFWPDPLEDYRRISNFATLDGLDLEEAQKKLQIVPHVISRFQENEKSNVEGGVDARYAITQSMSGNLTVNPDFATIEADREQVNLTRFELHLPEKRIFFFEGDEIYQQEVRLFYSRRIEDIYGGAKLLGKAGQYEVSALTAQTKEEEDEGASANFSVFRLKRDIFKSSTFGVLAANKVIHGRNQGTFGVDTSLLFSNTFKMNSQLAMSYGEGNKSDMAFFLKPAYDTSTFHFHFGYTYLGEYFGDNANAVGFIRDDNRHELDSSINKSFWLRDSVLDRISYASNYNIFWGVDKTLRSWEVFQSLGFDLRNKFSFKAAHYQEYKLYEKEFRNHSSTLEVGYNTREWSSVIFNYRFGRNFDSDFTLVGGRLRQNLTRDFALEYELSKLSLDPDPDNESTWIHVLQGTQYFTKDLFLKLFYQINSVIDKRNIQVTFVYRFLPPLGLVQLAYQKGTAEFGEAGTQGHTLFLKATYVF